jgi:8-oxo-dGTP pyrophosphatase MutT (NUDIX family)
MISIGDNSFIDGRIRALERALAERPPRLLGADEVVQRASVALLVRPRPLDLEILLIERPQSPTDPWSGHMALPGGRRAPGEAPLDTAIRETREEVGIDPVAAGVVIGRLDDVSPARGGPQIAVSPFVFAVGPDAVEQPDPREVASTLWIPLGHLADPAAAAEHLYIPPGGHQLRFPALLYHHHVIWGLTYRMLIQFIGITRVARRGEAS